MIGTLRTHALVALALFVALLLVAVGGNVLFGGRPLAGGAAVGAMVLIFSLFLGFGFSMVPVMVLFVLRGARPVQKPLIWAMWTILALGCLIAIPAAISDGFFEPRAAPAEASPTANAALPATAEEPAPLEPDPRYTLPDYKPEERRTAPD